MHAYASPGLIYYTAKRAASNGTRKAERKIKSNNTGVSSLFMQGGLGLQYKCLAAGWISSGAPCGYVPAMKSLTDQERDILTATIQPISNPARYDSFLTSSLGLVLKLGKHPESLKWHDALQLLYPPQKVDLTVCKKGDQDGDGVCDDWDKELNTPAGARVDSIGCAFDVDLDGVIDLYDKCVTLLGPASNRGCPIEDKKPAKKQFDQAGKQKIAKANKELEGIEFDLNRAVIKSKYFATLNEVSEIMSEYSDTAFDV